MAPLVALMLVPILGATALAVDAGYWYYKQRDMQNAADSAAIAGARTPDEDPAVDPTNDNYVNVAKGTAAKYGYVDGDGTVTVAVSRVTCPSGEAGCTQVIIGYTSPLFFSPIVGFQGNQNGAQGVSALAVAGDQESGPSTEFCLLALEDAAGVQAILTNGAPKADVNGCSIFSNSDMTCNGNDLNAGTAVAVGNIGQDCANGGSANNIEGADPVPDPYADYADIPDDPCTSHPQATGNNNTVASTNQISGAPIWPSSVVQLCGDIVLTGDVNVSGKTIVIYNGRLIANGHKFTATESTVIFSGSDSPAYSHFPTDTGGTSNKNGSVFDISAPDDGDWHGVAIYQDPDLTNQTNTTTGKSTLNITQSGNEPAFNISGLFYAPNSNSTLSGIVNKAGSGYNCFVLVVNTLQLNGTGQIFANALSECDDQGLTPPGGGATVNKWLVK